MGRKNEMKIIQVACYLLWILLYPVRLLALWIDNREDRKLERRGDFW